MEVLHGLSAVRAGIDHQAIASVQVLCPGDLAGFGDEGAEETGVCRERVGVGGDVPFGDDEHVDGRLRVDVREGEDFAGFVGGASRE